MNPTGLRLTGYSQESTWLVIEQHLENQRKVGILFCSSRRRGALWSFVFHFHRMTRFTAGQQDVLQCRLLP